MPIGAGSDGSDDRELLQHFAPVVRPTQVKNQAQL